MSEHSKQQMSQIENDDDRGWRVVDKWVVDKIGVKLALLVVRKHETQRCRDLRFVGEESREEAAKTEAAKGKNNKETLLLATERRRRRSREQEEENDSDGDKSGYAYIGKRASGRTDGCREWCGNRRVPGWAGGGITVLVGEMH